MNPRGEEEEAEEDGAVVAAGLLTKTFFKHQIVLFNIELFSGDFSAIRSNCRKSELKLIGQSAEESAKL